jgi:hypothetical protein
MKSMTSEKAKLRSVLASKFFTLRVVEDSVLTHVNLYAWLMKAFVSVHQTLVFLEPTTPKLQTILAQVLYRPHSRFQDQ